MIDAEDGKIPRNSLGWANGRSLRLLLNCQADRDTIRQCPADGENHERDSWLEM